MQRTAISSIIGHLDEARHRAVDVLDARLPQRARNDTALNCRRLKQYKIALVEKDAIGFREATMTVRAILDSKGHQIQSVEPDAKLSAAIKILAERKIGAVLVMNQGLIEGILSERDIVRVLGERGAAVLDEPVSAVMTRKVIGCKEADTVAAIMEIMTSGKFRHLPVIDDGRVVGLISIGDIVKWRVREYEAEQEALRDYIKTA